MKPLTLEQLMQEWEKDSQIDEHNLDRESLKQGNLHSKWLNLLSTYKMKALVLQSKINEIKMQLSRYYNGHMTKDELADFGRPQYQHKAPLKSELERLTEADPLFIQAKERFEINLVLAEFCESVIKCIRDRGFSIQAAIEWKKFVAGI